MELAAKKTWGGELQQACGDSYIFRLPTNGIFPSSNPSNIVLMNDLSPIVTRRMSGIKVKHLGTQAQDKEG